MAIESNNSIQSQFKSLETKVGEQKQAQGSFFTRLVKWIKGDKIEGGTNRFTDLEETVKSTREQMQKLTNPNYLQGQTARDLGNRMRELKSEYSSSIFDHMFLSKEEKKTKNDIYWHLDSLATQLDKFTGKPSSRKHGAAGGMD